MNTNVESECWFYGAAPLSSWKRGSFVYFIRSGDFIKIGWSKTPELRADQIRRGGHALLPTAGLAEDPVLLAYSPGTRKDEAALHQHFHGTNDQGEWFRRSPELDELIEETRNNQCALEVDIYMADYAERVAKYGWPAAVVSRDQRIQEQLKLHIERMEIAA